MRKPPKSVLEDMCLTPPPTLYHYTSMEVLIALLDYGQLRATHARYLNDSSEMRHVLEIVRKRAGLLPKMLKDAGTHNYEFLDKKLSDAAKANVFISCFSERADDLSQWRGYSPAGSGVCIGFRSSALQNASNCVKDFAVSFLTNVIYIDNDSGPTFDLIIKDILDEKPQTSPKPSTLMAISAPFYKNLSFRDEVEWRLVVNSPADISEVNLIKYRVGKSTLVPYIEVDIKACDENFIGEVIVGPSPNIELSVEAVRNMMNTKMKNVDVRASDIPYRHW